MKMLPLDIKFVIPLKDIGFGDNGMAINGQWGIIGLW
jgi:hypothetical protein